MDIPQVQFGSTCPLSADMVQTVQKTVVICTQFRTRLLALPVVCNDSGGLVPDAEFGGSAVAAHRQGR